MNYALWIAVALAAAAPAAYAQTVQVDGTDHQIEYSGAGVRVSGAVLDATDSLDLDVSADDDATLRITVPAGIFGSSNPSGVDVLVDFRPAEFEVERDGSDLVVSVQLDVASATVQILYDDQAGSPEPPAEPPEPEPVVEPPAPEPAAPPAAVPPASQPSAPEPAAPPAAVPPASQPSAPEPAAPPGEAPPPATAPPAEPASSVVCGQGTYERDGVCVPSCGPGLVLSGEACVPARPASGADQSRDLVYGTAVGFAVAFAALIIFWIMARASRNQQS